MDATIAHYFIGAQHTDDGGASFSVSPDGGSTNISLTLRANKAPLVAGTYEGATNEVSPDHPFIDGCGSTSSGRFTVLELPEFTAGAYTKFAVNYELACGGVTGTILYGSIRIDSDQPIKAMTSVAEIPMDFHEQPVSVKSAPKSITYTNVGTSSIAISAVAATGPHAAAFPHVNNCGVALAVGASCTVDVRFQPVAGGGQGGKIHVTSNDVHWGRDYDVGGTGTFPVAENTTPGEAKVIGSLPFSDAGDVSAGPDTGGFCEGGNGSLWYHTRRQPCVA